MSERISYFVDQYNESTIFLTILMDRKDEFHLMSRVNWRPNRRLRLDSHFESNRPWWLKKMPVLNDALCASDVIQSPSCRCRYVPFAGNMLGNYVYLPTAMTRGQPDMSHAGMSEVSSQQRLHNLKEFIIRRQYPNKTTCSFTSNMGNTPQKEFKIRLFDPKDWRL